MSINRACRRRNRQLRREKTSPKRRNSPGDYSVESGFAMDSSTCPLDRPAGREAQSTQGRAAQGTSQREQLGVTAHIEQKPLAGKLDC